MASTFWTGLIFCRRVPLSLGYGIFTCCQRSLVTSRPCATKATGTAQKAQVEDLKLSYQQVGRGSHAVLCLPGVLGSIQTDFGPQLQGLNQEQLTIVAWDPPGYGHSRPPDRTFSVKFFHRDADLAAGLMKTLGFKRYSLLGWSDGGITAVILAARHPEMVQRMIVWGANAYVTKTDMEAYEKIRNIDHWSERMRAPMVSLYGEDYFRRIWSDWVDAFVRIYEDDKGNLCKEEATQVKCPTLIIHGKKDPLVEEEHANYLHKNIQGSKLTVMPEGKHNLHLAHSKPFNQMVEDFLLKD